MQKEKFGFILPISLLAYFLILMDNSIIFTSSVQIGTSLGLSATELSWVSSAYTLTFGGCLLLSGRLSDLIGRRKIFLIGLLIFGVTSLCIGLAQNAQTVIVMRALQGMGSAILAPSTLAFIMDAYHGEMRQRAIAYYGATAGIGASIGLLIGGALTSLFSWRVGFLVNVPFTLALFLWTLTVVPATAPKKAQIDFLGSFWSILGLIGTIYGLTESKLLWIVIGVISISVFLYHEGQTKAPLLPLSLLKNRGRAGSYLARLLFMMALLPFWFFLPQMLQTTYSFSSFQSGLAFLPLTIVNFFVAMRLPQLLLRFGQRRILLTGEALLAVGFAGIALAPLDQGYWVALFGPMLIIGLAQGLILAPLTSAGLAEVPADQAGIASGLTNTMHQIGGPIGVALIVSTTQQFHNQVRWMLIFTLCALMAVAVSSFSAKQKQTTKI